MNRLLLVLKLGALVGLSVVEPLYHLVHHEVYHQDHEAHEMKDDGHGKKRATVES